MYHIITRKRYQRPAAMNTPRPLLTRPARPIKWGSEVTTALTPRQKPDSYTPFLEDSPRQAEDSWTRRPKDWKTRCGRTCSR